MNQNKDLESDAPQDQDAKKKTSENDPTKPRFRHAYNYDVVVGRELKIEPNEPLLPDKVASVRIEFGTDPKGFDYRPERIKTAWVRIEDERIPGRLVEDGTA